MMVMMGTVACVALQGQEARAENLPYFHRA